MSERCEHKGGLGCAKPRTHQLRIGFRDMFGSGSLTAQYCESHAIEKAKAAAGTAIITPLRPADARAQ